MLQLITNDLNILRGRSLNHFITFIGLQVDIQVLIGNLIIILSL